jgi:hypothetical protein
VGASGATDAADPLKKFNTVKNPDVKTHLLAAEDGKDAAGSAFRWKLRSWSSASRC